VLASAAYPTAQSIMIAASRYSVNETLRNGASVVIRAVRPDDRERIARAFAGLDKESVYTRFFSYRSELGATELARIEAMDFVREVMLVATVRAGDDEAVVGTARYVAHDSRDGSRSAEVAFTVEEDYQGQGLAGRLLAHLVAIARDCGITRFEAHVLPVNKPMLAVFAKSGLPMQRQREDEAVHVTLALSEQ
jgi:RimJ/RimL family protein N-acetyltransferase